MKVGVAILATDRLQCTMKLIQSMIKYDSGVEYDLWIFDDSSHSSDELERYIESLNTNPAENVIVYIKTGDRIGIAKNTNMALASLMGYDYKFIFNNDMFVKHDGWLNHYIEASIKTGIHHFCFNQNGLWGSRTKRPFRKQNINGVDIMTIDENPHGCLLFLDKKAFETAGYFDSKLFNGYGRSHHIYSHSISESGIQPRGIHDTDNSNLYFKVFDERSITPDKIRRDDYKRNTELFKVELKKLKSGEREIYTNA